MPQRCPNEQEGHAKIWKIVRKNTTITRNSNEYKTRRLVPLLQDSGDRREEH
jgi:hypothetical protein